MIFIIIVNIFPPTIDRLFIIDSLRVSKLNTIIIIKMLPSIDIKDIIRVILRAHDLPFNSPYDIKK
jgi:hypothetical protein